MEPSENCSKCLNHIRSLAEALGAAPEGDLNAAPSLEQGSAFRAMEDLFFRLREQLRAGDIEATSLATANVRLMLWNEAIQKINDADSLIHHGGDSQAFFRRVVADAIEMTGARYGALAVFDPAGMITKVISQGMDEATLKLLGGEPKGKGVLGALIRQQGPWRLDDIAADPNSCGFPPGHPPMKTFIGMPLRINGVLKGMLFLADKTSKERGASGECGAEAFSTDDEVMLGLFGDFLVRALDRIDLMQRLQASNHLLEKRWDEQQQLIQSLQDAQNQLLQSEKMASIGQLAAGVAHEINNPIGFISSNIGSLERYLKDAFAILDAYEQAENREGLQGGPLARVAALKQELDFAYLKEDIFSLVDETKDGVTRVRMIVQDLKEFSHVDRVEWQWADLHKGLDSTLNVVNNEIKYKATVLREYGALPNVECLPFQLNQVFMNLMVNAAHAITERGTITLRTGTGQDTVWVEVSDTGSGIAPENMQRIFDPFFTTKPVGKGTGLGLSLSYGIVQKHHGRIDVDSEPGKGSTFRVTLPIRQPASPAAS